LSQLLQSSVSNRLLAIIEPVDFALLRPHLTYVALARGEVLVEPAHRIENGWFLEEGIASVVAATASGRQTEFGIVGREGMVDPATLLDVDQASHRCFIQLPGAGFRIPAVALQAALDTSVDLRKHLLRYSHCFMMQVAGTALANASLTVERRLARWLLMCHDRIDGNAVAMTHEFLSLMLNVRRAGVTVAIQALESAGVVTRGRGMVIIGDRSGLEAYAGDAYGAPEALYKRLIAQPR
jgi:CRP-like cAMP-binding protein